jgi:hypothetical protein
MMSIETFLANMWWLGLLFKKDKIVHNKPTDTKPVAKAANGFWGMRATTTKQVMLTIHQGRNKPAAKLNTAINIKEDKNFIVIGLINALLIDQLYGAVKPFFY